MTPAKIETDSQFPFRADGDRLIIIADTNKGESP